jgi:hypothetical protein
MFITLSIYGSVPKIEAEGKTFCGEDISTK